MGQVDQVTQRTASAAEELSSTAAEMAAQAESLQQLLAFFRVSDEAGASPRAATPARPAPQAVPPGTPALPRAGGGNGPVLAGVGPADRDFTRF
jgi:methyl-accepting chemotaxis protein